MTQHLFCLPACLSVSLKLFCFSAILIVFTIFQKFNQFFVHCYFSYQFWYSFLHTFPLSVYYLSHWLLSDCILLLKLCEFIPKIGKVILSKVIIDIILCCLVCFSMTNLISGARKMQECCKEHKWTMNKRKKKKIFLKTPGYNF